MSKTTKKPENPKSEGKSAYRGRRFILRLYPDNYYQEKFLRYLESIGRDMVYILHDRTAGDKPHYHIIAHFDSPRTVESIISAAGKAPYYVGDDGKKHAFVLGVSPLSCIDKCEDCYIIPKDAVQPCHSVEDAVLYLMHQTFRCTLEGKEIYTSDALRYSGAGRQMFEKYTYGSEQADEGRLVSDIIEMYDDHGSNAAVIRAAVALGRMDIVAYIRKHPTFVNCFLSHNYALDPRNSGFDDTERG